MAREPSFPDDHPVGAARSARSARSGAERTAEEESRRRKQLMKGAAIGIGSAAVVAALLYARKGRNDKGGNG